jgi:hypothetical protein
MDPQGKVQMRRANMKTGGITALDKRDFGLDLRLTHSTHKGVL